MRDDCKVLSLFKTATRSVVIACTLVRWIKCQGEFVHNIETAISAHRLRPLRGGVVSRVNDTCLDLRAFIIIRADADHIVAIIHTLFDLPIRELPRSNFVIDALLNFLSARDIGGADPTTGRLGDSD